MHHPKIQLTRIEHPADAATLAARQKATDRLAELGHIDPDQGEINHGDIIVGWQAQIDDTNAFPVDSYAIQEEDGRVYVSVVFEVASLAIGSPDTGDTAPTLRAAVPTMAERTWGSAEVTA